MSLDDKTQKRLENAHADLQIVFDHCVKNDDDGPLSVHVHKALKEIEQIFEEFGVYSVMR